MRRPLELYIHIPFCERKCLYCDFLSMPAGAGLRSRYAEALAGEIRRKAKSCGGYEVSAVFVGGGTPSCLEAEQMAKILEAVREGFFIREDAEVTIECNPGTLTEEKLACYQRLGANRLSIGLQSAKDGELRRLGRIHTFRQFLGNYRLARELGFGNINVDLMFALPGQGIADWEETLGKVLELKPEHISAYSLIVEEGTPFYEAYGEDDRKRARGEKPEFLPEEETECGMYALAREMLEKEGYRRYEISNYAKPGFECRHNIGYWRRASYLGLGLGSASLMENIRFSNTSDLGAYLGGGYADLEKVLESPECAGAVRLDKKEQMEEFMFLGLRMADGVLAEAFRAEFGVGLEEVYGAAVRKFARQKLLAQAEGRVFLTEKGVAVSNYVFAGFLLEA